MAWRSRPSTCMGDAEHWRRRDELNDPRLEANGEGSDDPPGDTLIGEAFPRYRSSPSGAGRSRRSVCGPGGAWVGWVAWGYMPCSWGRGSVTTSCGRDDPPGRAVSKVSRDGGQSSPARYRSPWSSPRADMAVESWDDPHDSGGASTLMVGGEKAGGGPRGEPLCGDCPRGVMSPPRSQVNSVGSRGSGDPVWLPV